MRVLALAGLILLALTVAGPAAGASTCAKRVIDDWYDNGRVDGTYPVHCYDDAIDALPRDVRDYSSAKDDIQRALQARLRGEDAPPATNDPSPGTPGGEDGEGEGGGNVGTPPGNDGDGDGDDGTVTHQGQEGGGPEALGSEVDTAASDSVPVPLLVLAGLALLLVAAGSAGYLVRRLQARRVTPPAAE
jgi:hypothetical protein